jgi:hypothetical protein
MRDDIGLEDEGKNTLYRTVRVYDGGREGG